MLVWIRLSRLLMEWIEVGLLRSIGGMLGNTIKVDPITESQARGRFARICVEIDTTKPLQCSLDVGNRTIKVEYENLGLICFSYGRVGHSREMCKEGAVDMNEEIKALETKSKVSITESDPYGPWMQVSYGRNSKNYMGNNFNGKRNGYGGKPGNGDKHGTPRCPLPKKKTKNKKVVVWG
ncbi:hypothetical protein LWI29_023477 [Acer saccharum]|uniref:DUF4283 domain-containing protein n=1 Tax=Acer saccharum TaxID=4024 RepID=A0AA39SS54_ACESA|nr:hypothetical protein LWI29_023477 [Acer saccharum]